MKLIKEIISFKRSCKATIKRARKGRKTYETILNKHCEYALSLDKINHLQYIDENLDIIDHLEWLIKHYKYKEEYYTDIYIDYTTNRYNTFNRILQ